MALGEKEKKQLMGFIGFLGVVAAGLVWYFWHQPNTARMASMKVRIDSLTSVVEAARRELARGSVESLREKVAEYKGSVSLMRRLVPEAAEVPNLIDDVSSRAKRRNVSVVQWTPLGVEPGRPFETRRYRWSVVGHYDQIAEFLADIGSLPRIMVPYDVTVAMATANAFKLYHDTTGSLVEVNFQMKTFVKPPGSGDAADSTGAGGGQ